MKTLKDYPVIRPGEGEKILCVQRHHPLILAISITQQCIIAVFFLFLILFTSYFIPQIAIIHSWIFVVDVILLTISILLVSLIYTYMTWYYEFYVITNHSILHRFCFRIAGPYSEIVYGEKMHVREIDRTPPNLLFDFLKIEDVYVYFRKHEREEPFIFKTPENAQEIEDLLHDLAIIERKNQENYDQ